MASIPQLRKDINDLQEKLRTAQYRIAELESKPPVMVKEYVQSPPEVRIVYRDKVVEVPGPERVVVKEVQVPGPERVIVKEVPGPERVIVKEVPGPERIVYRRKVVVKEGPERIVYRDKVVEVPSPPEVIYRDKVVEVIGPERIVNVEVPGPERIVNDPAQAEMIRQLQAKLRSLNADIL